MSVSSHEVFTNYNLTMATLQERNLPSIDQASDKRPEINKMNGKEGNFMQNVQHIEIVKKQT